MASGNETTSLENRLGEEEIDFSDLLEQHNVHLNEGLDTFVVVDGLPVVSEDKKGKLIKFLLRQFNEVGRVKEGGVFIPLHDNMTEW